MLGWFAEAPNPDAGLQGFRQISDALGSTPWYLRLLRDEGEVAQRMAQMLASSRYATDLIMRAPEAVAMLGGDEQFAAQPRAALESEMLSSGERHDEPGRGDQRHPRRSAGASCSGWPPASCWA